MLPRLAGIILFATLASAGKDPALAVLESRCAACHSGKFKKSGLDITTREGLLRGGDRGAALIPGDAKASLLYKLTAHAAEPAMPHKMPKLADAEIAHLARWIDAGAPFNEAMPVSTSKQPGPPPVKHWAFQKPLRPALPEGKAGWNQNPIDSFIAATHAARGLTPVPEADRRTLIRRVYLDLAGVPPTRDELRAALEDKSPNAHGKLVDRLLDDPRYGERWARHWMDIWRYSDWYGWRKGNDVRNSAKHIWRWRDWIVESLNGDKGYDRMIVEMLAGDEVAPNDPQILRATGYLARSFSKYDRHGWMQDAVDHTAMGFLGVTVKCARCHDHKYDPITQEDYFRFRAFFEPYQVRTDRVPGQLDVDKDGLARVFDEEPNSKTLLLIRGDIQNPDKDHPLDPATPPAFGGAPLRIQPVSLPLDSYYPDQRGFVSAGMLSQAKADIEKAKADLTAAQDEPSARIAAKSLAAAKAHLPALEARIEAEKAKYAKSPELEVLIEKARKLERVAGVLKADESLLRAQLELTSALAAQPADEKKVAAAKKRLTAATEALNQPAEGYTPLGKSYPETSSGRRLALAQWIAHRDNPLTARVAINHIWLRHFGTALTPTVTDFGLNGKPPSHPQLLDWLATELMDNGWSMKRVHRLILTSRTYRMSSASASAAQANAQADPDNRYLWRMNPRRMEAEAVRDSILQVAGTLDLTLGGAEIAGATAQESRRRSIYIEHTPDVPVLFLKTFDQANPSECYERSESVVPHQALALSNSTLGREHAALLARRLSDTGQQPAQFVASAFETILGRLPSPAELAASQKFLGTDKDREDLVHVLFNHNDFVTIR